MEDNNFDLELTNEQILKSVSAAYDSVAIINELKPKSEKTDEEKDMLARNEGHIRIMMSKDWFVNALTEEQIAELKSI